MADVRLIPVVGVGLGAFAAGAAYQQVIDDLPNQPGGAESDDAGGVLGGQMVQLTQGTSPGTQTPAPAADDASAQKKRPVLDIIESLGNSVTIPKTTAGTSTSAGRPTPLKDAVKQASDGVKKTVDSVNDGLKKPSTTFSRLSTTPPRR